ncbi:MAG: GGDEF domain-containing protein [Telluria sp.]
MTAAPPSASSKLQRMLSYWAATAILYLLCILLTLREVVTGGLAAGPARIVMGLGALEIVLCYGLIRGSRRFGIPNWKLAVGQAIFAVLYDLTLYAMLPSIHAALLIGMPVVIVFSAFALRPRQTNWLGAFALVALVLTAAAMSLAQPERYQWDLEAIHVLLTAIGVASVAVVTGDLARLRARLHLQTEELGDALKRIERLAITDELTALPNRRRMHELLDQQERRRDGALALALIDLDHFKRINDTWGHDSGDQVLRAFARAVRTELREGDTLARWGGEEFLLLMPGTGADDARRVVERMRARVAGQPLAEVGGGLRVTFSAGLAAVRADEALGDAIRRADTALYQAKAAGRNCVVSAAAAA